VLAPGANLLSVALLRDLEGHYSDPAVVGSPPEVGGICPAAIPSSTAGHASLPRSTRRCTLTGFGAHTRTVFA
jgi:hypothetical protein